MKEYSDLLIDLLKICDENSSEYNIFETIIIFPGMMVILIIFMIFIKIKDIFSFKKKDALEEKQEK